MTSPPRPHLPTLLLDALLRPRRLAAFVTGTADGLRWAALLAAEVLVVTAGALLLLGMFIPFGPVALIVGPMIALVLTMLAALPAFFSLPLEIATSARLAFGFVRALIAVAPLATLGLTLIFSSAFPDLHHDPLIVLLAAIVMGVWFGGTLTVALLVSLRRSDLSALRWVGTVGAFLIGALIWWSEPLRQTEAVFFTPLLVGFAVGLLRPLSYLWEAPLSLGLALAARLGLPAPQLIALHPIGLDEICLLPLPGLPALLAHSCVVDITLGGPWLVQVAAHPSQSAAAQRALGRLIGGEYAHPVLFWLSTEQEGAAWLRRLCATVPRPHPLIVAYAALSAVSDPAAWPSIINAHRQAISAAAQHPGGGAVQALLEAGAQILAADRWPLAMAALSAAPPPQGVTPAPLWQALETVRDWSDSRLPMLLPDRARALAALWEMIDTLDGWPAALLAAMAEHLAYLLTVEHRRGAWLV